MAKASGSIDLKAYNSASQEATNYISYDPQTGLTVGQEDLDSKVVISGDGVKLYDEDGNVGTEIKSGLVTVGKDNETHLNIKSNGFELKDYKGNIYASIEDMRDPQTHIATVTQTYVSNGQTIYYAIDATILDGTEVSVYVDDVLQTSGYTIAHGPISTLLRFYDPVPEKDSIIKIVYQSVDDTLKKFTFGERLLGSTGPLSVAFGVSDASGRYSFAQGASVAYGARSFATGSSNAYASDSHAEGQWTETRVGGSHAEGIGTITEGFTLHAEGRYNKHSNSLDFISVIGIGEDEEHKANGLAVTTDGDTRIKGDVYAGCNSDSTGGNKLVSASTSTGSGTKANMASSTNLSNLAELTLPDKGVYILVGLARFASNANGRRGLCWGVSATGYYDHSLIVVPPVNGAITRIQSTALVTATSDNYKVYLNAYHTAGSGTQLNVDYYWRYIKLA